MSFFKHVGVANNKKVIIVQRQLPGEESHMAAVLYSDILPTRYHDDVMKVLESEEGQAAWEFKEVLQRRMSSSGENMLQTLSSENYIKRVPQSNIMVKPNSKSSIRLDELVKLLNEVGRGDQAVKKLEEMDSQLGLNSDPAKTNASRNKEKINSEVNSEADTIHYDTTTDTNKTTIAPDNNAFMMEMMKTLQSMQKEIAELKKPAKKTSTKPKSKAI
jgi:hypothetical protein